MLQFILFLSYFKLETLLVKLAVNFWYDPNLDDVDILNRVL